MHFEMMVRRLSGKLPPSSSEQYDEEMTLQIHPLNQLYPTQQVKQKMDVVMCGQVFN